MRLAVADMTCKHCTTAVTEAVHGIDPGATVQIDLAEGTVEIESQAPTERLVSAIASAGYPARPA